MDNQDCGRICYGGREHGWFETQKIPTYYETRLSSDDCPVKPSDPTYRQYYVCYRCGGAGFVRKGIANNA